MASSSTLPPSARLRHLWPLADRIEYLKKQQQNEHHVERAEVARTEAQQTREKERCRQSIEYFIENYVRIYDATEKTWIDFRLWPEQKEALQTIHNSQLTVILKARQLGLTWLVLSYVLWLMLFSPVVTALLFSLRDTEAVYLLSDERIRGMYERLPEWMRLKTEKDDGHHWSLANGSSAKAFPTSAGDSYTASIAIVDEADLVADLNKLMRRVKPTIDAGGKMILLSRSDKKSPQSEFKRIYRAAKQRLTKWVAVFLPWHVRPDRDDRWYAEQKAEILHRTGALDDLHEQYPATDAEALAPSTLDKRVGPAWINNCFEDIEQLEDKDSPAIPALRLYKTPERGKRYVIGIDPAEGNPTSDDSALVVLERETGEDVAVLNGKYEPEVIASHGDAIGTYFNNADVLVERNNHGHAVILWFKMNSKLRLLRGWDKKPGWLDNQRGKTLLYDAEAEAFRSEDCILHDFATLVQIQSIEGASLRAPEGEPDDLADAHALATKARSIDVAQNERSQSRSYHTFG